MIEAKRSRTIHHLGLYMSRSWHLLIFLVGKSLFRIRLTIILPTRILPSLRCFIRLHQFSPSEIIIPQPLQSSFSSHPRLPRPLPIRMHSLLSHSPLLDSNVVLCIPIIFRHGLYLPFICSSALSNSFKSDTPTYIL